MENDPHSRNKDGDTNRQEREEERLDEQQDHPNWMLRQEDEILRRDRNKFLIPPEGMTAAAGGQELRGLLAKAKAALLEAFKGTPGPESLNWLLTREARCSAAIESEFDETRIDLHYRALQRMLEQPAGTESLLECHQTMMEGQKHAQPGGYRTVNIQVGRHIAPEYHWVPELMAGLFQYLALTDGPAAGGSGLGSPPVRDHPSIRRRERTDRPGDHKPGPRLPAPAQRSHTERTEDLLPAAGLRPLGGVPQMVLGGRNPASGGNFGRPAQRIPGGEGLTKETGLQAPGHMDNSTGGHSK